MGKTKIEWSEAVWNPTTGCDKVSAGCKNCYAEVFAKRFWKERQFSDVRCHPDRLDIPLRWRKRRMVFVDSMSDLFHEAVPFDFIEQVHAVMACARNHTFQILTKRIERAKEFYSYIERRELGRFKHTGIKLAGVGNRVGGIEELPLKNCWLGVSVEDQKTANERLPILWQIDAAVKFVSYEPALGPLDFAEALPDWWESNGIDWVICGGESGPGARPMHPDWARSVRDQCQAVGVAFFFKQWGAWGPIPEEAKEDDLPHRWPESHDCGPGKTLVFRWGKKTAGRHLDGRTWNEMPGSSSPTGDHVHSKVKRVG